MRHVANKSHRCTAGLNERLSRGVPVRPIPIFPRLHAVAGIEAERRADFVDVCKQGQAEQHAAIIAPPFRASPTKPRLCATSGVKPQKLMGTPKAVPAQAAVLLLGRYAGRSAQLEDTPRNHDLLSGPTYTSFAW